MKEAYDELVLLTRPLFAPERQKEWGQHRTKIVAAGGKEPYTTGAALLLLESGCQVREWRNDSSGRALTRSDKWYIDVPAPSSPERFGVFAHEVAHQVLRHVGSRLPRWEEEVQAEEWALTQFDRLGLPGHDEYRVAAAHHLHWIIVKAYRRKMSPTTARRMLTVMPEWAWIVPEWRRAVEARSNR